MQDLPIHSHIKDYAVKFTEDFGFTASLKAHTPNVFIVDTKVHKLYPDLFHDLPAERLVLFEAKEENKELDAVIKLYDTLLLNEAKRNLTLISFGGGIVQDLSGFVASTLYRGIPWVYVPTTFLAQVDSCIGSKTSLNFKNYKNLIGTFYPPSEIYISTRFLGSLSSADFYSGLGEYTKFLLMKKESKKDLHAISEKLKALKNSRNSEILLTAIREGLSVKEPYLKEDEFDLGVRNFLNYGHDLGHALERTSQYAVPHGTAVVIGMIYANAISYLRGCLSFKIFQDVNQEILLPIIPQDIKLQTEYFNLKSFAESMKKDKKRTGTELAAIIPKNDQFDLIKVNDVTEEEFTKAVEEVQNILKVRSL